jgi:integrase
MSDAVADAAGVTALTSPLSGSTYKALAPPLGRKDIIVFDAEVKALGLRVFSSGAGKWIVQYRPGSVSGDRSKIPPKRITIGDRTRMGLADARKAARAVLARIDAGADPLAEREAMRRQDLATVGAVLDRYAEDCDRRGLVNRRTVMSTLRRGFRGYLTSELASLSLRDLLEIIETIEAKVGSGAAQDFRSRASAFMAFAVSAGLILSNPLAGYRRPRRTRKEALDQSEHGRVLTDDELARVWRAAALRADSFGRVVQFLVLSGCRRKEGADLRWDWLKDDAIHLPAASVKQGRGHTIPLSSGLKELFKVTPHRGELCWPTERRTGGATPISGWTQLTRELVADAKVAHFGLHDLRRTFRTWAEEKHGATETLAEAAIGHVNRNVLVRVYSRPQWEADLAKLFECWANHVESLGYLYSEPIQRADSSAR